MSTHSYDHPIHVLLNCCLKLGRSETRNKQVQYHANGPEEPPVEIDFSPPWRRIPMMQTLEETLGVTLPMDLTTEDARAFFLDLVVSLYGFWRVRS